MYLVAPLTSAQTSEPAAAAVVWSMLISEKYISSPASVCSLPSLSYSVTRMAFETGSTVASSAVAPDWIFAMMGLLLGVNKSVEACYRLGECVDVRCQAAVVSDGAAGPRAHCRFTL